jgi:hypothetical protein
MPSLYLPADVLLPLMNAVPLTHEVGGKVRCAPSDAVGRSWVATGFIKSRGKACRGPTGARLRKGVQCSIRKKDHPVSFHTHPKSNFPSSIDLRNSVFKNPDMKHYRGKRLLSIVVTRHGVWCYAPTATMVKRWSGMTHNDDYVRERVKLWSAFKRRASSSIPRFISYMESEGIRVQYTPKQTVIQQGGVTAPLPHRSRTK